jgi:hypothetical protein
MATTSTTALASKVLTFLSGCAGTVAAVGVAGGKDMGMPKWLVITCIVLTGGFAKVSVGVLPVSTEGGGKPANGG